MKSWHVTIKQLADGRWEWCVYHGPDIKAAKTNYATFWSAAASAGAWLREHDAIPLMGANCAGAEQANPSA